MIKVILHLLHRIVIRRYDVYAFQVYNPNGPVPAIIFDEMEVVELQVVVGDPLAGKST
jgi:hypothetical protein